MSLEETYQFKEIDSASDAMDDIDAFERRLNGERSTEPRKPAIAVRSGLWQKQHSRLLCELIPALSPSRSRRERRAPNLSL